MYNVAIIVIDTLREDYAQGLEALRQLGFVQYHGVAPAPWTLPSHISMITGLMPSQHGVHEAPELNARKLGQLARLKMHKYSRGIIGELERMGYTTAIFTANPYVTPYFGFQAKHVFYSKKIRMFGYPISEDKEELMELRNQLGIFKLFIHLFAKREYKKIIMGTKYLIHSRLNRVLSLLDNPKDKGGKEIYQNIRKLMQLNSDKETPYFILVNLMEAHEPYFRNWNWREFKNVYARTLLEGRCPQHGYKFIANYNQYAKIAIENTIEIVKILNNKNNLLIVVSDHGQGLCDPAFAHGYWLTDSLMRVPVWVRFPNEVKLPEQKSKIISLTEIPALIRYVLTGEKYTLGSGETCSESFGPQHAFPKSENFFSYRKRCI